MMIPVTVIIPIHNSEKYLRECVNSVLCQSFHELEVLCIDGGSTDDSGQIIKELQKEDKRLISIYDSNTSYGHKINIGIDQARGKYIAILESDDRMEPDMIEILYRVAETYDADIADGDYYELLNYRGRELKSAVWKYGNTGTYDCLIDYGDKAERNIASTGIWTGLYKKSFLREKQIRLNESPGASYQDLSFSFLTGFLSKRVYHINYPVYQYRVDNLGSSVKDDNKLFEIVKECEFLKNNLIDRGVKEKTEWDLYYARKYIAFYWNYCRLSEKAREMFLEKYKEELICDINGGAVARKGIHPLLYERTFLLLDNREMFIKKADENSVKSFLERACRSMEWIGNREVVLVGAGAFGFRLIDVLLRNKICIQCVCDNASVRQGEFLGTFKINSVKQAVKEFPESVYFITTPKYANEMSDQLVEEGIKREKIIIFE